MAVKILSLRQNRMFVFKSYLTIVGGLVAIAIALDFGIARLQDSNSAQLDPSTRATMILIEDKLAALPEESWPEALHELEEALGFAVRVLPPDDLVQATKPGSATQEVFDAEDNPAYLRWSAGLNAVLQIGPVPAAKTPENVLVRLVPALFYLSIFVFVGVWIWPLIRDLNVLTRAAQEFASDYRRPTRTLDEVSSLRDLASSLDEMSSRIGNLIQGQKELTGALSHEMRTPLTRIKFALAVINDKTGISDELLSIDQDVQELDGLVKTMLDYARLDHPDTEINRQQIPMDAWLDQIVEKFRAQNPQNLIDASAPSDSVQMDPYLVEVALNNLLVNACRYAKEKVRVQFSVDDSFCSLSVDDDGPGIPEQDRASVFKAFTRLDNSRNRVTGGYGLGLAIVARIAALHGGTAWSEQSDLGGARMVIRWAKRDQGPATKSIH